MKTNTHTSLSLALLALLTGSAVVAGSVAAAVHTTTAGVVGAVNVPPTLHTTVGGSTSGTVSASGVAGTVNGSTATGVTGAGASANGSAHGNGVVNANTQAVGTDFDTIGMRQERLQARADATASGDVKAIGQVQNSLSATAYGDRAKIDADISKSLDENKAAMDRDEAAVSADAKADYDASRAEVGKAEKALSESLKAAREAAKDQWEAARDDVAINYDLYATAVMRSRVIAARGSVSASGALDSTNTVAEIRSADDAARARIAEDIRVKLTHTEREMASAKEAVKKLNAEARESFLTAAHVAAHREREVKFALSAAEKKAGSDWARARHDVAVAYADYAEAVSRAELAASAHGSASVAANGSRLQTASNGTLAAAEHN